MLSLAEIRRFYPEQLQRHGAFLIREYLQYKILESIFESEWGGSLVFLGGTCLRLMYGNTRFSEDLDFDNRGLDGVQFEILSEYIAERLRREGYQVTIQVIRRGAFHCHVRFPALLFGQGLSGHRDQRLLIQIDTEPQNVDYKPELGILNKFDVFTQIAYTPASTLLSQKISAVLLRPRNKGRDFFDISFLLGMQKEPDWNYLDRKLNINNPADLRKALRAHCEKLDMDAMARDVEPFLFDARDSRRVIRFVSTIEQSF